MLRAIAHFFGFLPAPSPELPAVIVVPWRTAEIISPSDTKNKRARVAPERVILALEDLVALAESFNENSRPRCVCVHVQEIHKLLLEGFHDVSIVADAAALDTGGGSLYETTYAAWMRGWCEEPGPDRTFHVAVGERRVLPGVLAPFSNPGKAGECPVCYESKDELLTTACAHVLCRSCVAALTVPRCPSCRAEPCYWYGGPPQVATVVWRALQKEHLCDCPVVVVDERGANAIGNIKDPRVTTRFTITGAARLEFPKPPVVIAAHHDEKTLEYMCRYLRHTLAPKKVYACVVGT